MKKDFIGSAVLSTSLFPLKGRSQTTKEFLIKSNHIVATCRNQNKKGPILS